MLRRDQKVRPGFHILQAFNLNGDARPLPGGQNNSWRVGDFVLKYVGPDEHHEWVAAALSKLKPEGFRISAPVISSHDRFVLEGWTCCSFQEGTFVKGFERTKLEVSRLFHQSLVDVDLSAYHPANNAWQTAHRMVLLKHPTPDYPTQLVHGDLAGNILFHDEQPPLILDFSPTIAPVEYAEAILIADSIAWYDAPLSAVDLLPQNEIYHDMLVRAVMFRLAVAAQMPEESPNGFTQTFDQFRTLFNRITQ